MNQNIEMEKVYAPKEIEARLYEEWESNGYFTAKRVEGKKPFTIVMPPPNITGQLHMGHAMDCLLQDAPIRYHRMKGDPTLWLPGTDHAAIATEVKIVAAMACTIFTSVAMAAWSVPGSHRVGSPFMRW